MRAPPYIDNALRAIDPELRLRYDHARGAFAITRKPYGEAREELLRWLRTPEGGMVWPDWSNTVEWALEADWGRIGIDRALSQLDGHNQGVQRQVEARASDRMRGELHDMNRFALRKGMRLLGPPRA